MLGEDYFLMPCPKDMQPLLTPGVPVEPLKLEDTEPVEPIAPTPVPASPVPVPQPTTAKPPLQPLVPPSVPKAPTLAPKLTTAMASPDKVPIPMPAPMLEKRLAPTPAKPHQSPEAPQPLQTEGESHLQGAGASLHTAAASAAPALAPLLPTRAPMPVKIVEEPLLVQKPQQAKQPSPNKVTEPVVSINKDDRSVKEGVVKPAPAKVSLCH
jgi:hypothetical protein